MFMVVLLNYFKFESSLKKLQLSRISLVVNQTHAAMEQVLSLGTKLAESSAIESLTQRQLKSDSLVRIVDVANESNEIIFSTRPEWKGKKVESEVVEASARSGDFGWSLSTSRHFVTGRNVFNSFGELKGKVVISYDRSEYDKKTSDLLSGIRLVGFLTTAICLAVAALGLLGMVRRVSKDFDLAQECLDGPYHLELRNASTALSESVKVAYARIKDAQTRIGHIETLLSGGKK